MNEPHSPKKTPQEAPPRSGRCSGRHRAAVAVLGTLALLLVVGIFGPSWFPDRVAENLPEAPAQAELPVPGERPLDATQLMREAHAKTWPKEPELTGQIRKGSHKIPVALFRRDKNIQFQHFHPETKGWRVFHIRLEPVDPGQSGLLELKDGKTLRFPDQKLGEAIEGTDITYEDLAMPFLYWPNPFLEGSGEVGGQDCWVVRVRNPGTAGNYTLVRVWIHKNAHGLMQVVGYDPQEKALKRMRVTDIMSLGAAGLIHALMGRPLDRYTIREAQFASIDPVTGKTVGITDLTFDLPKKTPRPEDGAEQ